MSEYRRFIAYFYEYIDGRKQSNAGFAKVELRDHMWRILFRIKTDRIPEAPMQVFGFVRERGYLLGFLLGNMTSGYEIAEDWAYDADKEIGHEKYRFGNLSGVWIQSEDGRKFITVWDDDPIDLEKFVLQMPQEKMSAEHNKKENGSTETFGKINLTDMESGMEQLVDTAAETKELPKDTTEEKSEQLLNDATEEKSEQLPKDTTEEEPEQLLDDTTEEESEPLLNDDTGKVTGQSIKKYLDKNQKKNQDHEQWEINLFSRRKQVQPFSDGKLHSCIQIMPCDLMILQQKGLQIGRSSFLQHGFTQYHHLLFGRNADGDYVLGVPGIHNTQEQYMAQMFGYKEFLPSKTGLCGKVFGYWCRKL